MFRVSSGESFLTISSTIGDGRETDFDLYICTSADEAFDGWRETSRISPIWPVSLGGQTPQSDFDFNTTSDVLFISAVSFGRLYGLIDYSSVQQMQKGQLWLTLGVYNIVVLSPSDSLTEEIIDICNTNGIACEHWSVSAGDRPKRFVVENINYIYPDNLDEIRGAEAEKATQSESVEAIRQTTSRWDAAGIDYSILELRALLAVAKGRSRTNFPEMAKDCTAIVKAVELCLQEMETGGTEVEPQRLDILLSLNAGLSRLTSQAFSGTTPITRTECHFWPHSFLGIGVANAALRNIASFVSRIVRETGYHSRYRALLFSEDKAFIQNTLDTVEKNSENQDSPRPDLPCMLDATSADPSQGTDSAFVPTPITYYSGRDGFRNNLLTTSAPLLSVSGCNSVQWNLGTITHELSHRIVAAKLQDAYNDVFDWANKMSNSSNADKKFGEAKFCLLPYYDETILAPKVSKVRDLVCYLLSRALLGFYSSDFETSDFRSITVGEIGAFYGQAYENYSEEIEELFVHIFDFYHFYSLDSDTYVSYVWRSWAVQPTIMQKLEPYVKRTLIALSAKYFMYPNWLDRSFIEMRRLFDLNEEPSRKLPFLDEVNTLLNENEEDLRYFLQVSQHLIGLFYSVYRSERMQRAATVEHLRNPGRGKYQKNYNLSHLQFYAGKDAVSQPIITNPLTFVRDYSSQDTPSSAHSAWLLHLLALNYDDGERRSL